MIPRLEPDPTLLARVRQRLAREQRLRFVVGGAGAGKTAVVGRLAALRPDVGVIDMDARIYGAWGDRWRLDRHPAAVAWLGAGDPLAWQLAMAPEAFLSFQAALAVEALDLLADELATLGDEWRVVDGGFGSVDALALAVPPSRIACLAAPGADSAAVWSSSPERRAFLDVVAAVEGVEAPVERFLDLDMAMSERMRVEAERRGVAVITRGPGEPVTATTMRVMEALGIVPS